MKYALLAGLAVSVLAACGEQASAPTATPTQAPAATEAAATTVSPMEFALNGDWRSADNKARDDARNPAATLAFFGVDADETVVEISPGGGWYTEVLAPYLNAGGGTYIAATRGDAERDAQFAERFSDAETFGTVNIGVLGADSIPAGSADTVLTFRNIHSWMRNGSEAQVFENAFAALKPGGVFGVVEHRLPSSAEQDPQGGTGYVHQDYAIALAEAAGFELAGTSEINANPKDTADHPFGVWTLPPVNLWQREGRDLPEGMEGAQFQAIGESDRFTLKFVKPAAATTTDHDGAGS